MMDEFLTARLFDLARGALKRGDTRFSRFLDPPERACAVKAARDAGVQVDFYGGYDGAERMVAAFYEIEAPETWLYPIAVLEAQWDGRYASVTHRDLLGAEMALSLECACLGDIAMGEGTRAYLVVLREAVDYVMGALESAGRAKLRLTCVDEMGALAEPDGRRKHITVGSMRLDAVVAAAYDVSRSDAQRLIARELVKLNHMVTAKQEAMLRAGDLISVRGHGRAKVLNEPSETRKGRMALDIFVYGG